MHIYIISYLSYFRALNNVAIVVSCVINAASIVHVTVATAVDFEVRVLDVEVTL